MTTQNFYLNLRSFTEFNLLTEDQFFEEFPSDWSILITDIRGSTKAISEGRYKEVNTVGAPTIVVARKAFKENDFPFVFGGDGATLVVPNSYVNAVCENLGALKKLSAQKHGLDLRVGVVSMEELQKRGKAIEVGKFEITSGRRIAILRGEGLSLVENLVKGSYAYEYKEQVEKEVDLSGLSCRWNPVPSRHGQKSLPRLPPRTREHSSGGHRKL